VPSNSQNEKQQYKQHKYFLKTTLSNFSEILTSIRPDGNTEKALAAPLVTWNQLNLAHPPRLATVHKHFDRLLDVGFQKIFQRLIVLVLQQNARIQLLVTT